MVSTEREGEDLRLGNIIFSIPILIAVCGCVTKWDKSWDLGNYSLSKKGTRNVIDWEGTTSRLEKSELCSLVTKACFTGSVITPFPYTYSERERDYPTWFVGVPDESRRGNRVTYHFLDRKRGKPVICTSCIDSKHNRNEPLVFTNSDGLEWSKNGKKAVVRSDYKVLYLVELLDDGVKVTPLSNENIFPSMLGAKTFSPNESVVAWFECKKNCILHWYEILNDKHSIMHTPCLMESSLVVKWEDSTPNLRLHISTGAPASKGTKYSCLRSNGELPFPYEEI